MNNLSEEEIISILQEVLERKIEDTKGTNIMKTAIRGLLDLYQKEKEKNKELELDLDKEIIIKGNYDGTIRDILKVITPTPTNPVPIQFQMMNEYKLVNEKYYISKDKITEKIDIKFREAEGLYERGVQPQAQYTMKLLRDLEKDILEE